MNDTILVTGARGNIGSKLVNILAGTGNKVRAAVRKPSESLDLKRNNVELIEFDLTKPETIEPAFTDVTKLFLLTPFTPKMVEYVELLVDHARKAGLKHIVRLSAMGASSTELIPLRWHHEAEQIILNSGISFTILRPNFFMQNFVNFSAPTIKSQGAFYQPSGNGKVSYIDTRDIASAAAVVLTNSKHRNRIYPLTGSESLSNSEAAELLSRATGREIHYVDVPEEAARQAMSQNGMPDIMVDAMMNLMTVMKNGLMAEVSPTLEWILERKPITFEQFAKDHSNHFQQTDSIAV